MGVSTKKMRCRQGHAWAEDALDSIKVSFFGVDPVTESHVLLVDSGPLCPFCMCDDLKAKYAAVQGGEIR
jgi:hypothetical protein